MSERCLTKKEYFNVTNLYKSAYPNNSRFWTITLSLISLLLFSFLLIISYFLDNKSFLDSAYFGLMGPGLIGIIVVYNYILNWKSLNKTKSKWKKDLREQRVVCKIISVNKVWRVFDSGFSPKDRPDLLFRTKNNHWICVPHYIIDDLPNNLASQLIIWELKNTKLVTSVEFSGDKISLDDKFIEAKNEWRNDDLPYLEVFGWEHLSENLKKQLD